MPRAAHLSLSEAGFQATTRQLLYFTAALNVAKVVPVELQDDRVW